MIKNKSGKKTSKPKRIPNSKKVYKKKRQVRTKRGSGINFFDNIFKRNTPQVVAKPISTLPYEPQKVHPIVRPVRPVQPNGQILKRVDNFARNNEALYRANLNAYYAKRDNFGPLDIEPPVKKLERVDNIQRNLEKAKADAHIAIKNLELKKKKFEWIMSGYKSRINELTNEILDKRKMANNENFVLNNLQKVSDKLLDDKMNKEVIGPLWKNIYQLHDKSIEEVKNIINQIDKLKEKGLVLLSEMSRMEMETERLKNLLKGNIREEDKKKALDRIKKLEYDIMVKDGDRKGIMATNRKLNQKIEEVKKYYIHKQNNVYNQMYNDSQKYIEEKRKIFKENYGKMVLDRLQKDIYMLKKKNYDVEPKMFKLFLYNIIIVIVIKNIKPLIK